MAENKKFMSPFFGQPKEEETSEQKPMGYFDALFGDFKTGVGANFDSAINGARLNYQRGDIVNPSFDTTPEEYDALLEEHRKLAEEQAQTRQTAYETRKRLEDSGHNLLARGTTIGGSLPGLAINAGATALSGLAAVSGLGSWAAPLIRAGGVAASSAFDAYSAASEAADQVLENGGTEDQAYEAFTNAFPKQMVTAVPDAFADYLLSSKIAKGIAKTSVAQKLARNPMIKNGKSFLSDPASKVGTAIASATKSRNWGRVGSAATDILGQEIGEGIQETGQNYISNVEANRVLGKGEREYSLGGYGDYLTSDEGIETLKDVGLTTLVLGGAGSVLGSGQSLGKGYSDTNATKAVEGGVKNWENIKLDIDEKRFKEAKSDFQRGTGIDVSDYSPTDFARTYVEYYNNADGDHSQEHSKYVLNEVVKQITGENNVDRTTLSDKSAKWFANDMNGFTQQGEMITEVKEESNEENNANGEIDNANTVEQTATGQQVGETTQQQNGENTIKVTKQTLESMKNDDGTPIIDKIKQKGTTEPTSPNASNSVFSQHFDHEFNVVDEGADNKTYDLGGGHKVRFTAKEDGTFYVLDLNNPQNTMANVYKDWESAYSEMKRLQQQYAKEDASATRNLKATDGVLADKDDPAKSGKTEDVRKGTFAFTVDDIWNYYDNHIRGNAELEKEFGGTYGMMRLAQVLRAKDFDNTDVIFNFGLDKEQHDSEGNRVLGGTVFYTKDGRALTVNGSIAEEAQILRQQGVQKAIISLYRGNDVVTAMHELFHVGFWTMTEQERGYFYRIAPRTQNEFAEKILRIKVAHENELREKEGKAPVSQEILNTIMDKEKPIDVYNYLETVIKAQDPELYELIRGDASFSQTFELLKYQDVDVVKMLNQNGKLPDELQRALEERYAWEGSLWYAEGYVRSIKPVTAIQRILDRICHSLSTALGLVWDCSVRLNKNNHIEVDGRRVAYDPTVSFANLSIQTRDPIQQQQEQQAPVQEQTPATTQEQPFNPYETQSNDRLVDARLTAIPWYKPDYSANKKPVHNTNKLEVIFTRAINGDEKARDWFNRRVSQEQQEQILNKYLESSALEQEENNEPLNENYSNIPAVEDRFMDRVINEKEDAPEKTRGRKNDKREKQRRETQQRSIDTFKDGYNNFTDEEIPWSRTPFSQPRGVQKVSDKLARDLYERMTDETIPEKYRGRAETLFMTKIPIEQQKEVISEYEKVNQTPEQTEEKQGTVSINPEVQETQQNSQNQRQEEQQNKENKVVDNEDHEEVKEEKPNTTTQEWQDIPDKNAQRIYEKMMKGDERAKKHWDKLNSKQKERIINNNKTKEEERIRQEEQQNEENKVATPEKQGTKHDAVNNFINEREGWLDKAENILDTFISKNSDVDKLDINEIEKIFDNDEYRTIPSYISAARFNAEKFLKNKDYERLGAYKDSEEKDRIMQKLKGLIERAENLHKKYIAFDDKLIEERDKKEEQEKKREEENHKEEEVKQEDKYEKEIREKIGEQYKDTVQTLKTVFEDVDDFHERIQKYEKGELKTIEEKRNFIEEMRNKIYPLLQELKIVQNLHYVNRHGYNPTVSSQELSTKFSSPYPYATNRVESVLKEVVKHAGEMLGETLEGSSIVAGKPVYRMSTGRKRLEQLYKKYFGGKPELIDIRLTDNPQIKEKQTDTPVKEKMEQTKEQQPTKQKQERNEQKEEPKKEENKEKEIKKSKYKINTKEEMASAGVPWDTSNIEWDELKHGKFSREISKESALQLFRAATENDDINIRNKMQEFFSLYIPVDLQKKIVNEYNEQQKKENKTVFKENTVEEMKSVKLPWKFKEFSPDSVNAPTINLSDKIKLMKYFSKILFHRAMWGDTLEIRNSDEFRKLFSLYAPIDLQNKIIEDFKKIRKEVQQNVENEEDKKIKKDIEQTVFLSNANAEAITEITKGKYKNELYNEKYRTQIYNIIQNKLNVINRYNKKISGEKLKAYVRGRLEEDLKSHLSVAGDLLGETKIDKKGKEVYVISDKKQRKDLINLYKKYYGEAPTLTDPRLQKQSEQPAQNNEQKQQQETKQKPDNILNRRVNGNFKVNNFDEMEKAEVPWSVMKVENMKKRVSFDDLTGDVTREQAEEWFKTATDPKVNNQNEKGQAQAFFSLLVPPDVQKQIVQQAEQNTETTKQNDTEKTDGDGFIAKIGTKKIKIKNEEDILGYSKQKLKKYNEEEARAGIEDADKMVGGEPKQIEKPEGKRKLTTLEKNFINMIVNREDFLNYKSETFRDKVAKIKEELDKIVSGETEGLKNAMENAEALLKEFSYADGSDEKMQPYAQYLIKKISEKRTNVKGSHDMAFLLEAQLSLTQKYGKQQVDITEEQKQQVDDLMEYVVNPYMIDNERNNKSSARKEEEQIVNIKELHKEIEKCFDEFDKWLYRKEKHGTTRYMKMTLNDGRLRKRLENEYQKEFLIEGKKLGFNYDETKKIGQVINLVKRVMDRYNSQTPLLYLNPNDDLVFGERVKTFLKINHNVNEKIWQRSMSNKKKYQVDGLGVYRNLDGTWMVEISDKDAVVNSDKLVQDLLANGGDLVGKEYKLSDILTHDELYKKLPKLKDTTVYFVNQEDFNKNKKAKKYKGIDNVDFSGLYSYENKALYINLDKNADLNIKQTLAQNVEQGNIQKALSTARQLFDKMRGTILHETQHAVQHMTRSVSANANKVIALVLHNDLNKVYDFIEKNAGKQAVEKAKGMLGTETSSILKFLNKKTGTAEDQKLQDMLHDYMNQDEFYFADLDEMEAYDTENRATTGDESKLPLTQGKVEYDGKTYDAYNDVLQGKGLVQRNQMGSQQERVQRSQQILNTAFPNVRFQYAWHSTPHDFDAFTLDHLLEGEGFMAHGWGLYFAKSLPKNYKNYYKKFGKDNVTSILLNGKNITEQVKNVFDNNGLEMFDEFSERPDISNFKEYANVVKYGIEETLRFGNNMLSSVENDIKEYKNKNEKVPFGFLQDRTHYKSMVINAERNLDYIKSLINDIDNNKIRITNDSQSKILHVDIPNDDVLLREYAKFKDQPIKVQRAIDKILDVLGLSPEEKNEFKKETQDLWSGLFNEISYRCRYVEENGEYYVKETGEILPIKVGKGLWEKESHPEMTSRLLNQYGVKGISYNGRQDGECVVVFDNKAIDIINKFKREEGKWVSNKPQSQKQELTDTQKQRVERKLQEKKQSESATRYMGYGKPRMTKKKKEAMQEERKKWIKNQRLDAVTEQKIAYEHKDVYSVSFEKDAQNNPTNQKKMAYFEKNDIYWDKDEDKSTGRITYTRKIPEDHHKKVMSYSGINGIDVKQKEKTKWEEWKDWVKDRLIKYLINDRHFLAKAAMEIGAYDKYMAMVVAIDETKVANHVMEHGIRKPDGTYTKSLNAIIRDVGNGIIEGTGESKQKLFNDYCIAFRVLDLLHHKRWRLMPKVDDKGNIMRDANGNLIMEDVEYEKKIIQKMTEEEAGKIIAKVKNNKEIADLFEENRKAFVEYNHELLRVLVDGGIMTQKAYNNMLKSDPNYVPLSKVMDDEDFGYLSALRASSLVNINGPVREIGNSVREVANPLAEMQKRTAMYYSIASRNKAGRIFVNEIANKIEVLANGDKVARGQGLIRRVTLQERNNKLITKPDDRDQIIYIWNNGQKEFYQVASRDVYEALKTLDHEQLGIISKLLTPARLPAKLVRETATMVPDFGLRNFVRDNFEAFYTSENGFIPFWDGVWGIYQIINDTEWAREFYKYNGEYGTLNRENGDGIVSVDDVIDDKLNPITNIKNVWKANKAIFDDPTRAWTGFTDLKGGNFGKAWENTRKGRALALFKMTTSVLGGIYKSNKRMNDILEMGTRVAEFKNAKMGYHGTLDRLQKSGTKATLANATRSSDYAAFQAKQITLNFSQHGVLGKELNKYIPFFNASMQGIYKTCNTLDLLINGKTISNQEDSVLRQELMFKIALVTAMAIGTAAAGAGDEDYDEAPDYLKENFWVFPDGIRIPKDQVIGTLIGSPIEKIYGRVLRGDFGNEGYVKEMLNIVKDIASCFSPDKIMPEAVNLAIGHVGGYDTFRGQAIVPEYMADKIGHLQKDIGTSHFSDDLTTTLYNFTKNNPYLPTVNLSAKKVDWALRAYLTNVAKYTTSLYDLGLKGFSAERYNEKMSRGYDKNDATGQFVETLSKVPVLSTFTTSKNTYKTISDYNEKYKEYKQISSDEKNMTVSEKRKWKRYQDAEKRMKSLRKQLKSIRENSSLSGDEKRQRADKIFKQQIKIAEWAEK